MSSRRTEIAQLKRVEGRQGPCPAGCAHNCRLSLLPSVCCTFRSAHIHAPGTNHLFHNLPVTPEVKGWRRRLMSPSGGLSGNWDRGPCRLPPCPSNRVAAPPGWRWDGHCPYLRAPGARPEPCSRCRGCQARRVIMTGDDIATDLLKRRRRYVRRVRNGPATPVLRPGGALILKNKKTPPPGWQGRIWGQALRRGRRIRQPAGEITCRRRARGRRREWRSG